MIASFKLRPHRPPARRATEHRAPRSPRTRLELYLRRVDRSIERCDHRAQRNSTRAIQGAVDWRQHAHRRVGVAGWRLQADPVPSQGGAFRSEAI